MRTIRIFYQILWMGVISGVLRGAMSLEQRSLTRREAARMAFGLMFPSILPDAASAAESFPLFVADTTAITDVTMIPNYSLVPPPPPQQKATRNRQLRRQEDLLDERLRQCETSNRAIVLDQCFFWGSTSTWERNARTGKFLKAQRASKSGPPTW